MSNGDSRMPWGPDDQIGAMNHVAQETLVPLLRTVERGKIYDLSQVIEMGAPQLLPFQSPFVQSMYCTAGNTRRLLREAMNDAGGAGVFLERVEMTMHVGTHIDALGHVATEERMYNGKLAIYLTQVAPTYSVRPRGGLSAGSRG